MSPSIASGSPRPLHTPDLIYRRVLHVLFALNTEERYHDEVPSRRASLQIHANT